ncbi:MAG: 30S ribosomal protein S27ae [Candidatus Lokiarchaeota archaeon]|nr:30S ribosomal protein S27ae [Candidatus Lokiarchaeota archaeon]MBD3199094.1 30S ribosomal protein S27ae [Candidatus Lokiarchaeota archaeon]
MTDSSKYYKMEGDKLIRTNRTCPKCGPSVFMADHYDRSSCGRCGYTVFKRKGKSTSTRTRRRSPRKRSKSK